MKNYAKETNKKLKKSIVNNQSSKNYYSDEIVKDLVVETSTSPGGRVQTLSKPHRPPAILMTPQLTRRAFQKRIW